MRDLGAIQPAFDTEFRSAYILFHQKGHKMHYNAYIITKSLKHIIFISGEILFGLNDDEIRPFSVIFAGIDTEFAQ